MDKDSLPAAFWYLEWSFFVTVAYQADRNKKSCYRQMHALYDHLSEKYGDRAEVRMFFFDRTICKQKGAS
jgi:hypothetical protein